VKGQVFVTDQIKVDPHPAAVADVGRSEIDGRRRGDQRLLEAGRHGEPNGHAAVVQQQAAAEAAANAGLTSEEMAQLKELAALKEQGIITEAEFEVQKAKLMA
jgi:hypothetical protein